MGRAEPRRCLPSTEAGLLGVCSGGGEVVEEAKGCGGGGARSPPESPLGTARAIVPELFHGSPIDILFKGHVKKTLFISVFAMEEISKDIECFRIRGDNGSNFYTIKFKDRIWIELYFIIFLTRNNLGP